MEAIIPEAEKDPKAWLDDIASRAKREETLCGDGAMVWHVWGEGVPIYCYTEVMEHGIIGAEMSNVWLLMASE